MKDNFFKRGNLVPAFILIVGLLSVGLVSNHNVSAQSTNPCSPISGSGSEINLSGDRTQYVNVSNPGAVVDKNSNSSAVLQPVKGVTTSSYLAVSLPKPMVVTKVKVTMRAQDAKFDKVNGYIIGTGYGSPLPNNQRSQSGSFSPFNYCSIKNMQTVSFDNTNTLTYVPVNTNNKTTQAEFVYIYNVRTDGSPLGVSEIKVEGFDQSTTSLRVRTILKGTAGDDEVPISKVTVYDISKNESNPPELGKTNDNGELVLNNLTPPYPTKLQVGGDDEFKAVKRTLTLDTKTKESVATFEVEPGKANIITGNVGTPGETVRLKGSDGTIKAMGISDNKGDYKLEELGAGDFNVEVAAYPAPFAAKSIGTAKFAKAVEQSVKIDKISQPKSGTNPVTIRTFQMKNEARKYPDIQAKFGLFEITYDKNKRKLSTVIGEYTSPALLQLHAGCYTVANRSTEYHEVVGSDPLLCINGDSHQHELTLEVNLDKPQQGCLKLPQGGYDEFWFCGEAGQNAYKDSGLEGLWVDMGNSYRGLQKKYNLKDAPIQIMVDGVASSGPQGAHYAPYHGDRDSGSCPWAPVGADPKDAERVVVNPEIFNIFSLTLGVGRLPITFETIYTHEWGHLKDWRLGQCKEFNSMGKNRFHNAFELMWRRWPGTLPTLHSGSYDGSLVGYPLAPNPEEAYAEAFAIGTLHPEAANIRINLLGASEPKRLLRLMIKDALSTAPIPQK